YFWNTDQAAYWGTPLVPRTVAQEPTDLISTPDGMVLDKALTRLNFQFQDSLVRHDSTWLRAQINWKLDDVWSLRSDLAYNDGDRLWQDVSGYRYEAGTGLVSRSPSYIRNYLDFWNARLALTAESTIAGHRNRFLIGVEHTFNDHDSVRMFAPRQSVDPY